MHPRCSCEPILGNARPALSQRSPLCPKRRAHPEGNPPPDAHLSLEPPLASKALEVFSGIPTPWTMGQVYHALPGFPAPPQLLLKHALAWVWTFVFAHINCKGPFLSLFLVVYCWLNGLVGKPQPLTFFVYIQSYCRRVTVGVRDSLPCCFNNTSEMVSQRLPLISPHEIKWIYLNIILVPSLPDRKGNLMSQSS